MSPCRPLPDSDEMDERRSNERLLRWSMVMMGLILLGLAVLVPLLWVLEP